MHEMLLAMLLVTSCRAQIREMEDRLLRTLADMQNLRDRSERQIAQNKQFAIQVWQPVYCPGVAEIGVS